MGTTIALTHNFRRGEVLIHKTSLTLPILIEGSVPCE